MTDDGVSSKSIDQITPSITYPWNSEPVIPFDDLQPTVFLRCCQFLNLKIRNLLPNSSEL